MSFEIMLKDCIKMDKETIFEDDMDWVRFYCMVHLAEAENNHVTIIPKDNGKEDLEKAILNRLIEYKGD